MSTVIRESAGGHRMRGGLGDGAWAHLSVCGAGRRAAWFAALLLGICLAPWALSATAADASLGELSFLGCIGQVTLNECAAVPPGFDGAVEEPKGLAVSPDGANVYAADDDASTIDVFAWPAPVFRSTVCES